MSNSRFDVIFTPLKSLLGLMKVNHGTNPGTYNRLTPSVPQWGRRRDPHKLKRCYQTVHNFTPKVGTYTGWSKKPEPLYIFSNI